MQFLPFLAIAAMILSSAAYSQGLVAEDERDVQQFTVPPTTRGLAPLPARFLIEGMPPVGSQSRTGTCVGWATAYAAGSYFHRVRLGQMGTALSPAFVYALGNGDDRCLRGSRVSVFLNVMRDVGALPLTEYAFDPGYCGRLPTDEERRRATAFRIPDWAFIRGAPIDRVKEQLETGHPVIFSITHGTALNDFRGPGVFDVVETGPGLTGHAMVAVGYDDALSAVRIQNSAGDAWGDHGQAWMSYHVWREKVSAAFVILTEKEAASARH
jgi:hypothetical protein